MGWLLCILGLAGIVAEGRYLNIESVASQYWTLPVCAAGLGILLIERSALAYWAALTVGGGWLYFASTTYLDTSGWAVHGELMALTLILCGTLLSANTLAVNYVAVFRLGLLSLAIWGVLIWSQQDGLEYENIRELVNRYQEYIPRAREIALEAACVLGTVWVLNRVRSDDPAVRAHLLMTGGLILVTSELAWSWSVPSWRHQVLLIGWVFATFGLAAYIVSCFAQKRYMALILVPLLIGIGGKVALTTWQDRVHATTLHLELAHTFMIGMIVVAAAALTTGMVDALFSSPNDESNLPSLLVGSSIAAWAGIATTVLTLIIIATYSLPSIGSSLLTLLAAAACMFFFLSVWAAVLIVVDESFREAIPEFAGMRELWLIAILKGPKDFGSGPSLALGGTVLLAVLGFLPEWSAFPFLRLVAATLLVVGVTSMSSMVMLRLQEDGEVKYATDPSSHRLEHMAHQAYLVPIGVGAGMTATTLMFVVTADIWLSIRIVLALLASAGFVIATIPLLYGLAAPTLRRAGITLEDLGEQFIGWLKGGDRLQWMLTSASSTNVIRRSAIKSGLGLCVGVASIVFSAAFQLYLVLEVLLILMAVVGIVSAAGFGWLTVDGVAVVERDDLLARTRTFAHSKRSTFRLLPELDQASSDR
ncbi:hypothetical protein FE391_20120 [Nonomuraea sp. KC401]|uniref:hypothetical protein n=1 Tax=unclassified Nonomuraea TaxID=2593643 RepID=UPI0010FE8ABA|nr:MULTISPECIES: hypothetical protein [unclassified Nonomuraea]NBE95206.1 hypothetical protein [Nonomuraea sp. K271]TLF71163.1 hypothetical protein FE391_20120 [Nonomuraea sp. KC401]